MACIMVIGGCAAIDHTKGVVKMHTDQTEEGVQDLGSASKRAPTDAGYKIDYLLARDEQVRVLMKQADELRAEGKFEEVAALYNRISRMDPNNVRAASAQNQLKQDMRNERLLAEGENFLDQKKLDLAIDRANQVLDEFPSNKRALRLKSSVTDARLDMDIALERNRAARNFMDSPVSLQFVDASLKSIFEGLSKSANINILFDKEVKQDSRTTIFIKDVSASDAIDLILMQNQLKKRVMNGNTLIIYPATAGKQSEYEDLTIKTFQVTNADIKYLVNMLKSMLKLKELSADEKTGILVIRDTPESLRMAERLIAAHDVPDPEIMLEVEVLEVSEGRDSNLGLRPPTGITISTPGKDNSLTLGGLKSLSKDDLLVSALSTTLNFKLEDTDAKLLASPRIRARNKETAKIMIGDRVPTVTNTVTPVATGTPVVTGNVTYQDVGLKLEFEPQVYANNEVGIKISLEVSNIAAQFTDSNGGRSYQIGTRNASTNLRLKDGETQILGGLITDNDRNTASKIPGLGHLPIFGRLFGNNAGSSDRTEIVLAITPRIVRNLAIRTPDVKNIFSGTYNTVREKPILADPVTLLTTTGTFVGDIGSPAASTSGPSATGGTPLINPAPASTARTPTIGTSTNGLAPLPAPPPMVVRPAVSPVPPATR